MIDNEEKQLQSVTELKNFKLGIVFVRQGVKKYHFDLTKPRVNICNKTPSKPTVCK